MVSTEAALGSSPRSSSGHGSKRPRSIVVIPPFSCAAFKSKSFFFKSRSPFLKSQLPQSYNMRRFSRFWLVIDEGGRGAGRDRWGRQGTRVRAACALLVEYSITGNKNSEWNGRKHGAAEGSAPTSAPLSAFSLSLRSSPTKFCTATFSTVP